MGDVVLVNFRDRRRVQPARASEEPAEFPNKNALHDHMRTQHGYGGPRSMSRAEMDRIHNNRHADPNPAVGDPFRRPHSHL